MNHELQIPNSPTTPGDLPPSSYPPAPQASQPTPPAPPERRAHGKIGRLPRAARDKLNSLISDGLPFADIPPLLGDIAKDITARDLSRWHCGPHYQRWLLDRDFLQQLRADQEPSLDLLHDFDSARFNQGVLQLAITRLFVALRHTDSANLNQHLGGNAPPTPTGSLMPAQWQRPGKPAFNILPCPEGATHTIPPATPPRPQRGLSHTSPVATPWEASIQHPAVP